MTINPIQIYWFVMATLLYFAAGFLWLVWWQVRGVRGLALATAMTSAAIIVSCFGILQSHQSLVPELWLLVIHRTAWWPLLMSSLLLADLYAADHNDHRSLTTICYLWYKRTAAKRGDRDVL